MISQYFGLERLKERILDTRLNDVVVNGEVVQQANEVRDNVFGYALPLLFERPVTGQGPAVSRQYSPSTPETISVCISITRITTSCSSRSSSACLD